MTVSGLGSIKQYTNWLHGVCMELVLHKYSIAEGLRFYGTRYPLLTNQISSQNL